MKLDLQHIEACARAQMSPTPQQALELVARVRELEAQSVPLWKQVESAVLTYLDGGKDPKTHGALNHFCAWLQERGAK